MATRGSRQGGGAVDADDPRIRQLMALSRLVDDMRLHEFAAQIDAGAADADVRDALAEARAAMAQLIASLERGRARIGQLIEDYQMSRLLTSEEAAEMLGISERRVRQLARDRQVGRVIGRTLVLTPRQVATLRDRARSGRPSAGEAEAAKEKGHGADAENRSA